ncbi:MAG: hypothetical protein JRN44_00315 [Nitrososphaerota archaeon]|jgi:hypothetical protein|nr:hypothetical protein [Nitrososphaerota archaeon]MDG6941877.1 hypothetical protein [Nitrososphaerota archaeon]MDG6946950.1 hypothetical protein [Nitrososphaerota archaeon]MDG6950639.1 hypothetical protein [Nitrososphaerota archaeon]
MNWRVKERLLAMGVIISVLSLALMVAKGAGAPLEGMFGLGLVLLILGVFWKR